MNYDDFLSGKAPLAIEQRAKEGIEMKFAACEYRIRTECGPVAVLGYAVDCGSPELFCVRQRGHWEWRADHWETGYAFGEPCLTKEEAAISAMEILARDPKRTAEVVASARRHLQKHLP